MAEGNTEATREVDLQDRVTIRQAAALLGVHPNTIRKRVKEGLYEAVKVSTEHGFTWMVHRNSLLNTPPTRDSQTYPIQPAGNLVATPEAFMQGLLRPFVEDLGRVREELGAERTRREQAERERDELLEALRGVEERPLRYREGEERGEVPLSADTEQPRRRSWWQRWFGLE
jgi:hypothetical protein